MSASQSPANRNNGQSYSALNIGNTPFDETTPGVVGFSQNQPSHSSMSGTPDLASTIDYTDFSFPYQNIPGDGQLADFEVHDVDSLPTVGDRAPPSSSGDLNSPSILAPQDATATAQGPQPDTRLRGEGSDDGNGDGNQANGNNLEDNMSDDLGLSIKAAANGPDGGAKAKDSKANATPAWSELKTKAGKERKRLPLACIACRRKKIRCSGEKPACKHCLRSRIPCVYKVTTRKAAPRTDYMAMLDKRLKRMEDRIIKIVPKSEQNSGASNVTRAIVKPALPGTAPSGKQPAKKRNADDAFGADLDHWARAENKSNLDVPGNPMSAQVQEGEEEKLMVEGRKSLPPQDIQEHLADVFFDFVYGQVYHLLHKPSYMRKLKANELPPVLILSVCALSARFSSHPYFTTSPNFLRGEEWAAPAREIVMKRYEFPSVTLLTCMLLIGLHEFGTCQGGRSWYFGGQAIRMAIALQLHQDLEYDPQRPEDKRKLTFVDREIRRRTMWACFMMDRFSSSAVDRPMFVKEEWLKIQLPIKEKLFRLDMPGPTEDLYGRVPHEVSDEIGQLSKPENNMGVASYMIRVVALWGRIIYYLNQGGRDTDPEPLWSDNSEYARLLKQAEEFSGNLPSGLVYSAENLHLHVTEKLANQFIFLHVSIQQNILFMNRFAVSSPVSSPANDVPKEFVTKAGAGAFAAANRISEHLKDAEAHFIAAPFVGYCAFLSSTVHIFGMFSGNTAVEFAAKRNLEINVKFISKMKRYWGMFHFMSENLREQYRLCADANMNGTPTGKPSTESPIFQYGDWFARYPNGVSQSDFIDPVSSKSQDKSGDAVLEQKPRLRTVEEFFEQMSPTQSSDGRDSKVNNRRNPAKRRSMSGGKKASVPGAKGGGQQHPDPAGLTMSGPGQAQQHQRQENHNPQPTNQGPGNLPLHTGPGIPHARLDNRRQGTNIHAPGGPNHGFNVTSPLDPTAMGAGFRHGGPHHHVPQTHPHNAPSLSYNHNDLIALSLSNESGGGGMPPQLDRQMVYDTYNDMLDPSILNHGGPESMQIDWGAALGTQLRNGGTSTPDISSAWFMPFNVEPPKLDPHDMAAAAAAASIGGAPGTSAGDGSIELSPGVERNNIDPFAGASLFSPRDGEGGLGYNA